MEQEKYKRVVEISRELDMLNEVVKELNNPDHITTLRFCWTWNPLIASKTCEPFDIIYVISEIFARLTVIVIHDVLERRNQLCIYI